MTAFVQVGGEPVIRTIVRTFVERMVADPMIGFFFDAVDHERLIEMEYQFTARFLGAEIDYTGKPIGEAHRKHQIFGGQFERRRAILEGVLDEYEVDAQTKAEWLGHVDALRDVVVQGPC